MLKLHILSAFLISLVYSAPLDSSEDVPSCLIKDVYEAAYSEMDCTRKYDFFSNDTVIQKKAYIIGKDCFLDIVRDKCSKSEYTLISLKYDQIVATITEEPEDKTSCNYLYTTYNDHKFLPISKNYAQLVHEFHFVKPKMNDPQLLNMINLCDKLKTFMSLACSDLKERKILIYNCEVFQMYNTPFSDCMTTLQTYPPSSSKYSCLQVRDFNASEIETRIEMLTIHKDCTKEIMKDSCGEKALEKFDEYAEVSVKELQIRKAATVIVGNNATPTSEVRLFLFVAFLFYLIII